MGKLKSEGPKVAKSVSGLETLSPEFEGMKFAQQRPQQAFARRDANSAELETACRTWVPNSLSFSMKEAEPVALTWDKEKRDAIEIENNATRRDGIISYLTMKHDGNVAKNGIVTITSKSVQNNPKLALKNVADLTSASSFKSKDAPGQWLCWDFRDMRVRPTHYTIKAWYLKSWVLEGSLDGWSWTEIDRETDSQAFVEPFSPPASFPVSSTVEFHLIRLTQTHKNHERTDVLYVLAVEFFGTLSE
jgi:hypothetical protein